MGLKLRVIKESISALRLICANLARERQDNNSISGYEEQQLRVVVGRLTDILRELYIMIGEDRRAGETMPWEL